MCTREDSSGIMIMDESCEYSAPQFFDFINGESEEDMRKAELWFEFTTSYAPSPFMPRIETGRSCTVETLCNFSESGDQMEKDIESSELKSTVCVIPTKIKESKNEENNENVVNVISTDKDTCEEEKKDLVCTQELRSVLDEKAVLDVKSEPTDNKENIKPYGTEPHDPKPLMASEKSDHLTKKHQPAQKKACVLRNPSALKPKNRLQSLRGKSVTSASAERDTKFRNDGETTNLAQENQAVKRQKIEGGGSRPILNVKPRHFLHKTKMGSVSTSSNLCPSTGKESSKDNKKVYVREVAEPFVSMAEMLKKFQSSTRDLSITLPKDSALNRKKPKLTLTRPKEPQFETSQRVRAVRVKSTTELEEEMMANIPKFRARPVNKNILEAPTLLAAQRSTPRLPEFQEFHLQTMGRANQSAESSSAASTELSQQDNNQWKLPQLTKPKTPVLRTLLRARPPKVKSSLELEQEELEKVPKFKARPLNKKILESKGALGIFCNEKKHVTKPEEFHFATNERIPPSPVIVGLFDKISLKSENHDKPLPRNTTLNPFHLQTEERGAEKEKKLVMEVIQKQLEEERAWIPKASPYPHTTDHPVIISKPEPKQCTKPEPFQLESLVRHEEEMQKKMEERLRKDKEIAQRRIFKAMPILKQDPIPLPEKVRKPLAEVQEFNLNVDHRAAYREEFDQKVKEKETVYKRRREENDATKMMEEEKAMKRLRRTMVPHARPVPNFDYPFCPKKSSRGTTKAKSPNFRLPYRKERRNRFASADASSGSVSTFR